MFAPGPFASVGKIKFASSEAMWRFLRAHKGYRYSLAVDAVDRPLWHGIDKTDEERQTSKRTSRAVQALKGDLVTKGIFTSDAAQDTINKHITADYDTGLVRYKLLENGQVKSIHRIYELNKRTGLFEVGSWATTSGLDFGFAEHIATINFAE